MTRADMIALLDLTSLNQDDDAAHIASVCGAAVQDFGQVAAVCVYPQFVAQARSLCPLNIEIATVVNFPTGERDLDSVLMETVQAIQDGASEIDMVFPYQSFINGDEEEAESFCRRVVELCHKHKTRTKVILETGALTLEQVRAVAQSALNCGADFLKTSTGKIDRGATAEAVAVLLDVIRSNGSRCGLKVSGGVRTLAQAQSYVELTQSALGSSFLNPKQFRIGASGLLHELVNLG
ncbi:MAG: deoxyribose-phosphate aldolase [Cardiobacteriaceae bacterium]|nr:deoxyribose-phosphate aldolase [Cardiobacteriaceae bacterium]